LTVPDVLTFLAVAGHLDDRVRIIAVILTAVMLGVVLELVRRRRLVERYALLWMSVALILLVLAVWNEPLRLASKAAGVDVPANALFIAAFAVAFVMLLHFSVITTRLSEETKILAQEVARLDAEARAARAAAVNGEPGTPATPPTRGSQAGSAASTTDQ
jgi:hypothetical protein